LQALIRPHFLFNSMNTIASLTRSDPRMAERAVEDLADLLRANLGGPKNHSTLEDELEIATIYQRIEKLRLGDRLNVRWDLGEIPLNALLPNLTLQPLIENAIYHGVELVPDGGEVVVTGRQQDGRLVIEISNPLVSDARALREGNQMALSNIRQRFELKYGLRAQVVVRETESSFTVRLEFPLEEERP
jgi:two-component system sensor histidine kinase AlgZ